MGKQKYDWDRVKTEFISGNYSVTGKTSIELKELAKKYNISEQVIWNKSSKEKWMEEAQKAKQNNVDQLSTKLKQAVTKIDQGELMDEYKVRSENYKAATKLLGKLLKRWENLTDEEINKLAIPDLVKGLLPA